MKKDTKKEITTGKHFFLMFSVCQYLHFLSCKLCTLILMHISVSVLARSMLAYCSVPVPVQVPSLFIHPTFFPRSVRCAPPPFPLSRRSFSIWGIFLCNKLQDLFSSGSRQKDQKMFAYLNSIICSDNFSSTLVTLWRMKILFPHINKNFSRV